MKTTAFLSLSLKNFLRYKKNNIVIATLMVIALSIVIFSISVSSSLNDDLLKNVINNIDGRSIFVSSNNLLNSQTTLLNKLSAEKDIVAVTKQCDSIYITTLNEKIGVANGGVELLGANSKSVPLVSFGENLKDSDESAAIIPSNFYPDSQCNLQKNNVKPVDGKTLIGKKLSFESNGKNFELTVKGVYNSENCGKSFNSIYVPYKFIKAINASQNLNNDENSTDDVIAVVDSYENVESVINSLTKQGFSADKRISVDTNFSSFLGFVGFILSAIAVIISFFSILIFTLNSVNKRTPEIGLMKATGYTNFQIITLLNIETVIIGLLSFVAASIISSVAILIYNLSVNSGGNSILISVNLKAFILALIIAIITPVVGTLATSFKSTKIQPSSALKYE